MPKILWTKALKVFTTDFYYYSYNLTFPLYYRLILKKGLCATILELLSNVTKSHMKNSGIYENSKGLKYFHSQCLFYSFIK